MCVVFHKITENNPNEFYRTVRLSKEWKIGSKSATSIRKRYFTQTKGRYDFRDMFEFLM